MDRAVAAQEFLRLTASGGVGEAYHRFVANKFVHHNPYFESDRDALQEGMEKSASTEPKKELTIHQVIAQDDRVAVYSHVKMPKSQKEYAVMHIMRFEGDKIVELWDMGQEVPADSPNKLGMF